MASMNMEEQLEEQPTEKKPRIDNCQEKHPNESELPKSAEGDEESTALPTSRRHRKLPAELNREIYLCFNPATQRKFIWALGWGFYSMFRQKLLTKSKRLRNPMGNAWGRFNCGVTISEDGLYVSNTNRCQDIYAGKGFPISGQNSRQDNFPGTILYYYEVKIIKSERWCYVGLTDGEIPRAGWIPESANSYVIFIQIPNPNDKVNLLRLAGQLHFIEFSPEGVIRPEQN